MLTATISKPDHPYAVGAPAKRGSLDNAELAREESATKAVQYQGSI